MKPLNRLEALMLAGRIDELQERFGEQVAAAISNAYTAVLLLENPKASFTPEDKLAVIRALTASAMRGRTQVDHLKYVARRTLEAQGWRGLKEG